MKFVDAINLSRSRELRNDDVGKDDSLSATLATFCSDFDRSSVIRQQSRTRQPRGTTHASYSIFFADPGRQDKVSCPTIGPGLFFI